MNIYLDKAIRAAYPQVVTIRDLDTTPNAFDDNGNEIAIEQSVIDAEIKKISEQTKINNCKDQAKKLIANCDWAMLPDVNISNRLDFEAYRATLRNFILNPVSNPDFPIEPQPVWV